MTLHERVAVFAPSGALLFVAEEQQACDLIECGAQAYSIRRGRVSAIQLVEGQIARGGKDYLWPGSYGIKRDLATVPGRLIFTHKNTHAEELAAA